MNNAVLKAMHWYQWNISAHAEEVMMFLNDVLFVQEHLTGCLQDDAGTLAQLLCGTRVGTKDCVRIVSDLERENTRKGGTV